MSDSDDEIPLAQRALGVKKEAAALVEPANGHLEKQKTSVVKAEGHAEMSSGDGDASGAAGKSAGKEKMPNIPKTEPSSPKKASAEKPAKGAKTPASKKASAEKPGKPKAIAKAAKGAANNGKADNAAAPVRKERKVYELPGQTRDTPPQEDPLRKFYTSLREQRPDSGIAAKWLLQVGLLPAEEAKLEAAKLKNARSPVKAPRPGPSTPGAKRKRAAGGTKPSVAKAKPTENGARKKKQPAKRKAKNDESESEEGDNNDSDFDDQPLAKRKKPAPKKPAGQGVPKRPAPKGKKDVAFTDGGLDGEDSSDDDMPLAQRALKVNS